MTKLDPRKIVIEHYKCPRKDHSKFLIFLLVIIILFLLFILIHKEKIESGELLCDVMERNNFLNGQIETLLDKKMELKKKVLDYMVENRIYFEALRIRNLPAHLISTHYKKASVELTRALRKLSSLER